MTKVMPFLLFYYSRKKTGSGENRCDLLVADGIHRVADSVGLQQRLKEL